MGNHMQTREPNRLVLDAETAADLMTANPVSIRQDASLPDAADLLTKKDVSAVPVLDHFGHPVGVLSRTDLVRYFRERSRLHAPASGGQATDRAKTQNGRAEVESVRGLMTPALLSVPPEMPALEVVAQLLGLGNVHQLFVVDKGEALVGVVSARDVLRRLRRLDAMNGK